MIIAWELSANFFAGNFFNGTKNSSFGLAYTVDDQNYYKFCEKLKKVINIDVKLFA